MPELADILRRYGQDFRERQGSGLNAVQRRALWDIEHCRTQVFGGGMFTCSRCGAVQYSYHSCRNRSCPKCHADQEAAWLHKQRARLLPVPHFHTVLTVPPALHPLCREHPQVVYGILIREGAAALRLLAADPRFLGGRIGIMAVLHTWTADLRYHPHVHMLVPAVGLLPDGGVARPRSEKYLVPVEALSLVLRAKVRDALKAAGLFAQTPSRLWRTTWNTYCEPPVAGTHTLLRYLARYVFRIAITNARILSIENALVSFRCRDGGATTVKQLPVNVFLGRFVQHVLPRSFTKVRYYGVLAPACRRELDQLREQFDPVPALPTPEPEPTPGPADQPPEPLGSHRRCPCCKTGTLLLTLAIRPWYHTQRAAALRTARAPP